MMSIFDFLQLLGGIILAIGYIPQIVKIVRTHSAKDFNIWSFASVAFGISLMELYAVDLAIHGSGAAFLITNSLSLIVSLILLILIFRFRDKTN